MHAWRSRVHGCIAHRGSLLAAADRAGPLLLLAAADSIGPLLLLAGAAGVVLVEGRLICVVSCMQGLWNAMAREYRLADPAIHCPSDPLRFGSTNLLSHGIDAFFHTHVCNDLCKALHLERHPSQVIEPLVLRAEADMAAVLGWGW